MTDLSVSIVSYRTPALLRQCLSALDEERLLAHLDLQVTVVDNASGDGSAELVATEFPWVRLVRNARNVGFGAAHNQAIREAFGRYVLVLNSDARPLSGALRELVAFLDDHPDTALAGPQLRYPDGRVQPSRRRFPTLATLFLESTQLQRVVPRNRVLQKYYVQDRSDDESQEVDWLVGACLCVRADALAQVGLFDERFFMYSEELDWCRRFRAAGWKIAYVPRAKVVHLEGGSTRLDLAARDRQFQSSKLRYAAKWHGPHVAAALRAYLIAEYVVRAIEEGVKLAFGSRVNERRARLRVIGSGLRQALLG
ncbi:MAG TPA: glycosyltransferase family 2 protein [Chloroflexota bacterium]|jgi:GT2 family glycosyltransferase|nr:glycosyltransferase family 2 protein [Chloroflexota bacterium]